MAREPRPTFKTPLQAERVDGEVVVTGPEHLHGAFSANAARESARILNDLADEADGQPLPTDDQPSQTDSSDA
jgi:hypothetical protein